MEVVQVHRQKDDDVPLQKCRLGFPCSVEEAFATNPCLVVSLNFCVEKSWKQGAGKVDQYFSFGKILNLRQNPKMTKNAQQIPAAVPSAEKERMRDPIFLIFSGPIGIVKAGNLRSQLFPRPNLSRFASGDKTQQSNPKNLMLSHAIFKTKKPCPAGRHGRIHRDCEKLAPHELQVVSQGCGLNARITKRSKRTSRKCFWTTPAFSGLELFAAFHQQIANNWIHIRIVHLGCESLTPKQNQAFEKQILGKNFGKTNDKKKMRRALKPRYLRPRVCVQHQACETPPRRRFSLGRGKPT